MKSGGVFVVLLCGLAVAVLIAIVEFCWNSKRNASYEHVNVLVFIIKITFISIEKQNLKILKSAFAMR